MGVANIIFTRMHFSSALAIQKSLVGTISTETTLYPFETRSTVKDTGCCSR